ncbi:MAG: diadenylate cyclase [Gemmatales bacterium]|nr:diadenylate cyclase [Gemmatales bacterium]MCS7161699.1 diadenylate cyclase [Gemmatales bacterium]MDW8176902.1 diadenylate cyclase [Gemmatales bacterium]MDW8221821.1 diadenylate cyclase [Gemmatales bacterium]
MALPRQTVALLKAARQLVVETPADAILLLTETNLDWNEVRQHLEGCRLLVAAPYEDLANRIKRESGVTVLESYPGPLPVRDRLSLALLEAVASEQLRFGDHVVALYNGIEVEEKPDQIDSVSLMHLDEHLERLSARELRRLHTQVPLETLKAVVDVATEIGREGREGKPVGTMFVVGDHRKVLLRSRPIGFDPVRGYSRKERNLRDHWVRESVKEIAKLDGAIIVNKDGTIEAAARFIEVKADGINLGKGLGARHWTAAAISKITNAIAVTVSESTGVVRLFQKGEIVLHIEPLAPRPVVWRQFQLQAADPDG